MLIPIPAGSNAGKYKFEGEPKLINCYAEENPGGKAKFKIVDADGLTQFCVTSDTPGRGLLYMDDLDKIIDVRSGGTWDVTSSGVATRIGTIPGIDRVRIVRNKKATPQIAFQCGAGVYYQEGAVVTKLIDELVVNVIDIVEIAGYIVFLFDNGKFLWTGINEITSINALDFATAENSADGLVAGWNFGGYLWLFGSKTIEPWKVSDDPAFIPMPTTVPRGLIAKFSIAPIDNTLAFVGDNKIVYRLNGFSAPTRISNHEIERLIEAETDPSLLYAFSWSKGGHEFYCLSGQSFSKVYDANTGEWHDRSSDAYANWRVNNTVSMNGTILGGDSLSGKLFYLDETVSTEDGGVLKSEIRFPTVTNFADGGIVDSITFDYVTGKGKVSPTEQGYDPLLMVDYSKDGGYTFVGERRLPLGRAGDYATTVRSRRFGRFDDKGIVFRLRQSDPVPRSLTMADIKVRTLKVA